MSSYKDKVEGNELDLSLNELTEVPVKLLANTPKATHLDLSCNRIQTLPNDFATLTHLIRIDLSRNKLTDLPQNFGNLVNLQYLDLDRNELRSIPISFCRLKNLRWLDLKDNPLDPKLKAVAGDCLDEKQCQHCAKKIVMYMQNLDSNMEREKQKKLKEMRDKEALEKARVEKELEEKRKLKKLEKERRKAQSKAKNEEKLKQDKELFEKENHFSEIESKENDSNNYKKGMHWCVWLLPLICIILAIVIYFFVTSKDFSLQNISLSDVQTQAQKYILRLSKTSIKLWHTSVLPFAISVKASLMKNIHSIMVYISNTASEIELLLSVYF